MALIPCPSCRERISEHANTCPKCGLNVQEALAADRIQVDDKGRAEEEVNDKTTVDPDSQPRSTTLPSHYILKITVPILIIALTGVGYFMWQANSTIGCRVSAEDAHSPPEQGKDWRIPSLGTEVIYVSPGQFRMGLNDRAIGTEAVEHQVRISRGFWIGKYEITNREYSQFIKHTNYDISKEAIQQFLPDEQERKNALNNKEKCPIVGLSWHNSIAFCRWLTGVEREAGRIPAGYEYRLPTEAEWEFAARGGVDGKDTRYAGSNNIDDVAWYEKNSGGQVHSVGKKRPNELGIYDMSGNISEWCVDKADRVIQDYGKSSVTDPTGPQTGSHRIVRGGHCNSRGQLLWVAFRGHTESEGPFHGFRIVLAPIVH